MSRNWGVAYTVVAIVAFLGITTFGLLSLNVARETGLSASEDAFGKVVQSLSQVADLNNDAGGPPEPPPVQGLSRRVQEVALTAIRADQSLDALLIRSDGETVYAYARDRQFVSQSETDPGEVTALTSDSLVHGLLVRQGGLAVEAVYRLVSHETVFQILRRALLMVLCFSLVIVLLLIVVWRMGAAKEKRKDGNAEEAPELSSHSPAWPVPALDPDVDPPEAKQQSGEAPSFGDSTDVVSAPGGTASQPTSAEGPLDDEAETSPPTVSSDDTRPVDVAESEEPVTEEDRAQNNPPLFSPRTGVSYRQHLDHRLSQEIERAAYNEEDVTVALLSFPGLMASDQEYADLGQALVASFRFAELVFELSDDSFCLLLPNTNLDDGIKRVGNFLRKHPGMAAHAGLTSRNARLVEAERLLLEAEQASRKAESEHVLTMGFRPDPDLYRSFLTEP